jgi:membrane peptidoglycan carboxypeptidase
VYTLAAALNAGISLNSYWQWTPHDMPGRTGKAQIRNASTCPSDKNKSGACSLLDSTVASLNVPFYGLTLSVTPAKVLEMARNAGIDYCMVRVCLLQVSRHRVSPHQKAPRRCSTVAGPAGCGHTLTTSKRTSPRVSGCATNHSEANARRRRTFA